MRFGRVSIQASESDTTGKPSDPAADPKADKSDPKKDVTTVTELPVEEVKDEPEKSDK